MLYSEFLKNNTTCPFCAPLQNEVIKKNNLAFLTYSIAPYHKHHLMVIPNRHIEDFCELNSNETGAIEELLHQGAETIRNLGYKDYTILVRNGSNGKSVNHLHYHIVPVDPIGDLDHKGEPRVVMTEEEIQMLLEEIKKADNMQK